VIDAEKEALLAEIHQERYEVAAAPQELWVLAFADVVNPNVDLAAAGHLAGELFADKEIGMTSEHFRGFDRIVIGEGEKIHPSVFQAGVDLVGRAITFAAKFSDNGGRTRSGEV
jgi:hypothetical protein